MHTPTRAPNHPVDSEKFGRLYATNSANVLCHYGWQLVLSHSVAGEYGGLPLMLTLQEPMPAGPVANAFRPEVPWRNACSIGCCTLLAGPTALSRSPSSAS